VSNDVNCIQIKNNKREEVMNPDLLEAAMAAPAPYEKDSWHFIVVRSRQSLDKMTDFLPNAQWLKQTRAVFVVCGDITKVHDQQESYMFQSMSAAAENILLAGNAMGLGTCWFGVQLREDRIKNIRALFKLPDDITPICGVAFGWAAERKPARTRYNPNVVHFEKW
jgi:nitroreductase